MNIGFIGVGSMGRAMILRLMGAGHRVSVWNHSAQAISGLEGVIVLDDPALAFEQEVVISMLADDRAVQQVLLSPNALARARKGCIHIVMSTLSPAVIDLLQARHDHAGIAFVAAPVSGVPAAVAKWLELPAARVVRAGMSAAVAQGLGDRDWSVFASIGEDTATDSVAQPWYRAPLITSRRGHFWLTGQRVLKEGKHFQRGPMFVAWESPEHVTQPYPVVLVHGGTLQGTEWGTTPDGRPGWAQRFVEDGYAVFCVDRPGHGRSPYHPEIMGPMGPAFSYERAREVYFPHGGGETQWPFAVDDEAAFDAFIAAYGPMPANLAASQGLDADRLGQLLDRIGKAIIVTHSASGPDGWLVADRRPGRVAAIVAVEPMGPVFGETPGIGSLDWGLTAAPITFDPACATPAQVQAADPATLKIPALKGVPVGLVTGETSVFASFADSILPFLRTAGAQVDHLDLPALGIHGNGHGLIYERNSDEAFRVVSQWLDATVSRTGQA